MKRIRANMVVILKVTVFLIGINTLNSCSRNVNATGQMKYLGTKKEKRKCDRNDAKGKKDMIEKLRKENKITK